MSNVLTIKAQSAVTMHLDSIEKILDRRYTGGAKAFFKQLSQVIRYPAEARTNCRMGTVLIDLKIKPSGSLDSMAIKNDVEVGMGIEDEVVKSIVSTKGQWLPAEDKTLVSFSISFLIEDTNKRNKDKFDGTMVVVGYGSMPTGCPSNADIVKDFEKAKKKNNTKKQIALCEELLRRMPTSEAYIKELAALKK
jgi:hypothetical protein